MNTFYALTQKKSNKLHIASQQNVAAVTEEYNALLATALPENVAQIQAKMNDAVRQAVNNEGLSYNRYLYIAKALEKDAKMQR